MRLSKPASTAELPRYWLGGVRDLAFLAEPISGKHPRRSGHDKKCVI
jgi:hypothetical protein